MVCPLNWGIGHATRCIPVINALLRQGANVIIGAEGKPLKLLQSEFPNLTFVEFKGYRIRYPENGLWLVIKMMFLLPSLWLSVAKEHRRLQMVVEEYAIDAVISDSRYGLFSQKIPCIFMTHQLFIRLPKGLGLLELVVKAINFFFIRKFDQCWVPDLKGSDNLSGELSHRKLPDERCLFVGPLTRIELPASTSGNSKPEVCVVLSGPEPQRSIFEKIVVDQLIGTSIHAVVVRGLPDLGVKMQTKGNVTFFSHLHTKELTALMLSSQVVIARSGYSTLMDLAALGKRAVLVPTPGQTEQEYLAGYHFSSHHYFTVSQKEFKLAEALQKAVDFPGVLIPPQPDLLWQPVELLLQRCPQG